MKYLMNLSINIGSNLVSCNLRGEGRWEYNTLNALLSNGKTVHTTRDNVWRSESQIPNNLYDGFNKDWLDESVLMVHGAGASLYIEHADARAYIIQFHEPPYGKAKQDFLNYLKQNRIVATVASMNPFIYNRLASPFGVQNVYHLAGAMVPYVVDEADNFRKPNITWLYRNFKSFVEEQPADIDRLLTFLEQYLNKEPEMRVAIIVGLWDTTKFTTQPLKEAIEKWVWDFPVMQKFKHLSNRIDIHVDLHWHEILDLLRETRWIISPAEPLGCPAYEAAMFGIPTIVGGISPFMALNGGKLFPELLTSSRRINNSFLNQLNRLQTDHGFYRNAGDAYRKYTKENATFEAFVRQLDRIIEERGWDK